MKNKFIFYVGYKTLNTDRPSYTYENILQFVEDEKEAKYWVNWIKEVYKKVKNKHEKEK